MSRLIIKMTAALLGCFVGIALFWQAVTLLPGLGRLLGTIAVHTREGGEIPVAAFAYVLSAAIGATVALVGIRRMGSEKVDR